MFFAVYLFSGRIFMISSWKFNGVYLFWEGNLRSLIILLLNIDGIFNFHNFNPYRGLKKNSFWDSFHKNTRELNKNFIGSKRKILVKHKNRFYSKEVYKCFWNFSKLTILHFFLNQFFFMLSRWNIDIKWIKET